MDVRGFYKGKNILITGGTGYVGKVIAEKLLRCCDVGKIFLLIRAKPKANVNQRLDRIKTSVVFDVLKEEKPKELEKLRAIAGDLGEDGLALNQDDKKLIVDEVQVILHSAASINMAGDIKELVDANLCGTRRVLTLASELRDCQVFVYISTGFVHPKQTKGEQKPLSEVAIPISFSEEELLMTINRLNKNERKRVAPLLLGNFRNWYTASKAYAEAAVAEERHFPRVIVRPSSISAAWKEPFPGFHDSLNAFPAIIRGMYTGVIRRFLFEYPIDNVPIDLVVNAVVVSGCKAALEKPVEPPIYHATVGPFLPKEPAPQVINTFVRDYPSKHAVWFPNLRYQRKYSFMGLSLFFYQWIPAVLLDLMLFLAGKRPIFRNTYKNYAETTEYVHIFGTKFYQFRIDKLLGLHKALSEEERSIFYTNLQEMNWEKYYRDLTSGVRRCLLKETHDDLKAARKKNQILRALNFLVECTFHGLLWWLVSICSGYPLVWLVWVPVLTYCIFTFIL